MRKKILVTASTFPRWEGDTEPRFILDLCKHMTSEYDVTALVPATPGAKKEEDLEGVHVIRYHYFPIHKWETLCYPGAIVPRIKEKKVRALLVPFLFVSLWMKELTIIKNYDLVHAHWLIPQGIVQSFFKKPYIVTGHGGDVTSLNKGPLKALKKRCLTRASGVTAVSQHLKEKELEIAPDIKPEIISMGVDATKFGAQHRVENYYSQGGKKVILFVGRLAEKKGVKYLIEAMNSVDNALLYIIGNGPLRQELEELAKPNENIVFVGSKTHEELKVYLSSADVFVAPSVTAADGDQEGLPTTILEAMASGTPVVGSRHGGISIIINDGVNGFLTEERDVNGISDSINKLIADESLRKQFVENGLKTVADYDYRTIASKYMTMIKEALEQ